MTEKTIYRWKQAGVGFVALVLLLALVWGRKQTSLSQSCVAIEYHFRDAAKRMYLESEELDSLLINADMYPVNRPQSAVSLQRMEEVIAGHPMIRHVECYRMTGRKVMVQLTQRAPLMQVRTEHETYYVDRQRHKMDARQSITDSVLVVKGALSEEMACTEIADFAQWLEENRYWRERVKYLDVRNPFMVHLYLKGYQQPRVILGEMEGFQDKLAKLRTFFENGTEVLQDKHYKELDLRFSDQVVGRN
jgi:cell division protein FtsQ